MLNPKDPAPLYEQLTDIIRRDIRDNIYPPGSMLPTEQELCERYNISRITVRKALGVLEDERLIVRKPGKGTFVLDRKMTRNIAANVSFSDICRENGKIPGGRVLRCEMIAPDREDRHLFRLGPTAKVVLLERIRYASGEPVSIEISHLPKSFSYITKEPVGDRSLFEILREHGTELYPARKEIELAYASARSAKLLHLEKGHPLISILSVSTDISGRPIHRNLQLIVGDKLKFYI